MRVLPFATAAVLASFASCGGQEAANPNQGWISFQQHYTANTAWYVGGGFFRSDVDWFRYRTMDGPCGMVGEVGSPYDLGPSPPKPIPVDPGKIVVDDGATIDFPRGWTQGDAPWRPGDTLVVHGLGSAEVPAFTLSVRTPKRPSVEGSRARVPRTSNYEFEWNTDSTHMHVEIVGLEAGSLRPGGYRRLYAECMLPVNGIKGVIPASVLQRFEANKTATFLIRAVNLRNEPIGKFTVRVEATTDAEDISRDVFLE